MRFSTLFTTASVFAVALTGAAAADGNQLVVEQIGNDNFEDSGQSGSDLETLVQQEGNANTASVSTGGAASVREDVAVRQNGNANFAAFGGDGGGSRDNDFGVLQDGNRNSAAISIGTSRRNEIGIAQDGNENTVAGGLGGNTNRGFGGGTVAFSQTALTMSLNTSAPLSPMQDAPISGNDNFVGLEQLGARNVVGLSVTGNNNTIVGSTSSNSPVSGRMAIDLNADFGSASIFDGGESIDGEDRSGNIFPGGGVTGFVDTVTGNFAVQDGVDNQAALKQDGNDNIIAWGQIGNDHMAEITQVGNNNMHLGGQSN